MAIQTYNDLYLHYIAENLGVMFEHAVDISINPTIFWNTFIKCQNPIFGKTLML